MFCNNKFNVSLITKVKQFEHNKLFPICVAKREHNIVNSIDDIKFTVDKMQEDTLLLFTKEFCASKMAKKIIIFIL